MELSENGETTQQLDLMHVTIGFVHYAAIGLCFNDRVCSCNKKGENVLVLLCKCGCGDHRVLLPKFAMDFTHSPGICLLGEGFRCWLLPQGGSKHSKATVNRYMVSLANCSQNFFLSLKNIYGIISSIQM